MANDVLLWDGPHHECILDSALGRWQIPGALGRVWKSPNSVRGRSIPRRSENFGPSVTIWYCAKEQRIRSRDEEQEDIDGAAEVVDECASKGGCGRDGIISMGKCDPSDDADWEDSGGVDEGITGCACTDQQ